MAFATLIITYLNITERSQMPKLLIISISQRLRMLNIEQADSLQQGKTHRCNAARMILYSFILVSDAEAEEGEGKPLFGSSCPGAENKHVC